MMTSNSQERKWVKEEIINLPFASCIQKFLPEITRASNKNLKYKNDLMIDIGGKRLER